MKVTKIVREFVEEEVDKKYPLPELDKTAAEQLDKDICDIKERVRKEAGEFILNKLKEAGVPLDEDVAGLCSIDWRYCDKNGNCFYKGVLNNIRETYNNTYRITQAKRERAIKDILVTLELGGTKKELMEMLANLPD